MDMARLTKRTVKISRFLIIAVLLLGLSLGAIPHPMAKAATPGLPFIEDFSDTDLRDSSLTNANWSTEEQALLLAWRQARYAVFAAVTGSDISVDAHWTNSVALGDVDGDGDLDLVAGNWGQANQLYLNNGTSSPFSGVTGSDVSADTHSTFSVALGDVDGDGDMDLVAGNSNQTNRLYLNNGTAYPFSGVTGSDVSADPHDTRSVALGDVDGDGDLDLVAGNFGQTNRLYLNNGTASPFSGVSGSDIGGGPHNTTSVALGDVDGDGDLDLVAGNWGQANRLYMNNGTSSPYNGVFGKNVSPDDDITYSVALGDMDGDGDLDLLAGNFGQANRLYLNNGTASPFSGVSGSDVSADAHWTDSIVLGDVDRDGDLDLVAGNYGQANRLYVNNGTSSPFSGVSGSDVSADTHTTTSVVLGDVDGDGDLDLVVGNQGQTNRLYLNNGTASPFSGAIGSDVSVDAHDTTSVALGDVDGDGDLDLLAGNRIQANRLYLNNGTTSPFSGVSGSDISADAHPTISVSLGDMDGDGDLDLVAGNDGLTNRLYLNNGTASPFSGVSGSDISADTHYTTSVALGDVDRDGDLDLIAGNFGQANRLYLNNGTASPFSGVNGSDISADTHDTFSVTLEDLDGEGYLDLVAGNQGQANRLYLNNGAASPFSGMGGSDVSTDAHKTFSVALGDVDGDGDLDLVAGNYGQANRLYLNNGTASPFSGLSGNEISTDDHLTKSVVLGDVDGDGDLDLVAGNEGQANRLYLNNGTASPFSGAIGSDVSTDTHWSISVALGDVDRDGDLDLVAGNYAHANRLYLNNGTASPFSGVSGSDISTDAHLTFSVVLGDVDGDGDLDLVAGNDQANRLYLNNGTASPFSGVSGGDISADTHYTTSVALGDVDRDGDLDLMAGNWGQTNRLYMNNGTVSPFSGVSGTGVSTDTHNTSSVALGDVNWDGDLDLVVGNVGQANRVYLNSGTASPFSGVTGGDISADTHASHSVALVDVDVDGKLDLIVGNSGQANRLYRRTLYHTGQGQAGSLRVDTETANIGQATLSHTASLPPNTLVTYRLSNNGGAKWFIVQPGVMFVFPTAGTDLRWRAELHSLSPVRTPRIDQISITGGYSIYLPLVMK